MLFGSLKNVISDVGCEDVAGGEEVLGQRSRDGAGPAADVEEFEVGVGGEGLWEMREEVGGAVGGGAPFVVFGMGGRVADDVGGVLSGHFGYINSLCVVCRCRCEIVQCLDSGGVVDLSP